jgi:tetratricopeptide (TPR) repeat protein
MRVVSDLLQDARAAAGSRDWGLAEQLFRRALDSEACNAAACYGLAEVLALRGRFKDVVTTSFRLVDILVTIQDYAGALETVDRILGMQPQSTVARLKKIEIYAKLDDGGAWLQHTRELARILIELGHGDQSIELLKTAEAADNTNLEIGLELAEVYVSYGQIADAARQYQRIAGVYLERGDQWAALECLRRKKVVSPNEIALALQLGRIYVGLGRYTEGEHEFRSILRHDLNSEEALLELGRVCQLKGQWRDAILAFNRILTLNPEEVLARLHLGQLYQVQGLIEESVQHFLSAAYICLESLRSQEAVEYFQIVLGLDPANPAACRELTNLGAPLIGISSGLVETTYHAEEPSAPVQVETVKKPSRKGLTPNPVLKQAKVAQKPLTSEGQPALRAKVAVRKAGKPSLPSRLELPEVVAQEPAVVLTIESSDSQELPVLPVQEPAIALLETIDFLAIEIAESLELPALPVQEPAVELLEPVDFLAIEISGSLNFNQLQAVEFSSPSWLLEQSVEAAEIAVEAAEPLFCDAADWLLEPVDQSSVQIVSEPSLLEFGFADELFNIQILDGLAPLEAELGVVELSPLDLIERQAEQLDGNRKIEAYRNALDQFPANQRLQARLADALVHFGLLEEAVHCFQQLIVLDPKVDSHHNRLAQAQLWNEDYQGAAATWLNLAQLQFEQSQYQAALESLQSLLALDPQHLKARQLLVQCFQLLSKTELAVHHLDCLAETASALGDDQSAIQALSQLQVLQPSAALEERLARAYLNCGESGKAVDHLGRALQSYRNQQQSTQLSRVLNQLLAIDPQQTDSRQCLIEIYQELQQPEQAASHRLFLAKQSLRAGRAELGLAQIAAVLVDLPGQAEALRLRLDCHLAMGSHDLVLADWKRLNASSLESGDVSSAIQLTESLLTQLGERLELAKGLARLQLLAGQTDLATQQWLKVADLAKAQQDWDSAALAMTEALQLNGQLSDVQLELAVLLQEQLNNPLEALAHLQQLSVRCPQMVAAIERCAQLLVSLGRTKEAAELLNRVEQGSSLAQQLLQNQLDQVDVSSLHRYRLGELAYHLGEIDLAIEQFQQTRRDCQWELHSYKMLGLCFAEKRGFNMLDLGLRQITRGLAVHGHSEREYQELRMHLVTLNYQAGRLAEALAVLRECYLVDIAYPGVQSWMDRIESELSAQNRLEVACLVAA